MHDGPTRFPCVSVTICRLRPLILLAGVEAARPAAFRGLHRLAVDDAHPSASLLVRSSRTPRATMRRNSSARSNRAETLLAVAATGTVSFSCVKDDRFLKAFDVSRPPKGRGAGFEAIPVIEDDLELANSCFGTIIKDQRGLGSSSMSFLRMTKGVWFHVESQDWPRLAGIADALRKMYMFSARHKIPYKRRAVHAYGQGVVRRR